MSPQTAIITSAARLNKFGKRLVELKQGKVHLKKADGSIISLPLSQLSKANQEYIKKTFPESFPKKPTPKWKPVGKEQYEHFNNSFETGVWCIGFSTTL